MKKLRSALALLLCLAISLTLTPAAFAEEPTGDYLVWEETPAANEAAPVIEIQPQNTTAADGTQTTFSVTAAGGSLKYQWQYRTSSSGSWTNSTSTSGKTKNYTVNARTAIDGYQYRCRVSNSAGTVYTSVVTLTVSSSSVSKPVITQQPTNFSAPNGTQTTISVTATGTGLQYQWEYRKSSSGAWTNSIAASANSRIFTVNARTAINGYQYRCRVSNSAGEVYTNVVTLTVTSPSALPTITTQPRSVTAADGTTATFTVAASGTGLSYQWQYRTSASGAWKDSTASSGKTSAYTVNARTAINGYQYRCKVSNSAGTVYSSIVTLTVAAMPTITTQPSSVIAADGTKATFTIAASGPDLQYQWQYRASSYSAWTDSTATSGKTKTYTVNARAAISGYQYRCRVYNAVGEVYSAVVTLNIQLDAPSITSATVKGTIVTLTWSAVPAAASYEVYMAKSGDALEAHESGITGTTFTISGLDKNTSYNFAVAAVSGSCNAMSSTVTLTTGDSDGVTTYRALLIGEENFSPRCTRNRGDVGLMSNMLSSVSGPDGGRYSIATRYDVDNNAIHSAIISTFSGADSDDVSLFFIATHGVTNLADGTYAGALSTLVSGGPGSDSLPLETLASWLGAVPGKVIVFLGSCGSGAAVFEGADSQNGIAANAAQADPDAFNEAVVQAFAGEDRLVLSGEHTYYFGENGGDATLQFNLGDFCTSKFYVLTAARHQESSWGWEAADNPSLSRNVFTDALVNGVMNTMPADTNGDSVVNLHELFLYIKANATDVSPSQGYYQHVQEYPKNSTYKLFKK